METSIRASEAAARGFSSRVPAPEPEKCRFCGKTLEYVGHIIPFIAPNQIFGWSDKPERCTCAAARQYWAEADRRAEEEKKEAARREEQERIQARIGRLIKDSGMRGRFQNRTFERWEVTDQNRRAFNVCKRYADAFDMMLPTKEHGKTAPPQKERNGILIIGGYGTGKTHLAASIANRLMQNGTPVICMTMIDMLARIRETFDKGGPGVSEAQIMRLYAEVPLLIIDDLGSEQATEWGSTTIYSIINARYEGYMPTIVTSNCGVDELVQRMTPPGATDRNAAKTVDRLREMCVALQMDWPSWRSK